MQKHHHHLRHGKVVGIEHVAVAVHLLADAQQLGAAQLRNAFPVAQDEVTGRRQPNDVTRASQQQSHAENPPLHTIRPPRRVPPAEIDEISPLSSTSDCCRWRPAIEVVVDSSVKGGALVRRITPSAEKLLGRALPQTGQPARHDLGVEGALWRCQRSNSTSPFVTNRRSSTMWYRCCSGQNRTRASRSWGGTVTVHCRRRQLTDALPRPTAYCQ